jgi:hypothetical protein
MHVNESCTWYLYVPGASSVLASEPKPNRFYARSHLSELFSQIDIVNRQLQRNRNNSTGMVDVVIR